LGRADEAKPLHLRYLRAVNSNENAEPIALRHAAHSCLFLGEYALAENILRRLLMLEFDVPSTHTHLARLYLLMDRHAEARAEVAKAWKRRAEAPAYVTPRILFLQVALSLLSGHSPRTFLGSMKDAFITEGSHLGWSIEGVINHLKPRLTADDFSLLQVLSLAINESTNVAKLDAFIHWREASSEAISDAP
jgi:hypothetical protein